MISDLPGAVDKSVAAQAPTPLPSIVTWVPTSLIYNEYLWRNPRYLKYYHSSEVSIAKNIMVSQALFGPILEGLIPDFTKYVYKSRFFWSGVAHSNPLLNKMTARGGHFVE